MKIVQDQIKEKDVILIAKGGGIALVKVVRVTRGGAIKYQQNVFPAETTRFYDFEDKMEWDKDLKISSIPMNPHQPKYFWLIERDGKRVY